MLTRMPHADYVALPALNISSLKEMKRSPMHYKHRLTERRVTDALTLGTATHSAVLEPERFAADYAVWTNRTEGGAMSPRRGKVWDEFVTLCAGKSILTADESDLALAMQAAIRANPAAMKYLASGGAELTLTAEMYSRPCKGRIDWFTDVRGRPTIVGLKSARDCRPFVFGKQAAVLGYHMQWAFYFDLYLAMTGVEPAMKEIVVESAAPHAVAVYHITEDIILQGREDYLLLLGKLADCEESGEWPGPVDGEEDLTLPTWAYTQAPDDIAELELEK
jgi:hypothetical protein